MQLVFQGDDLLFFSIFRNIAAKEGNFQAEAVASALYCSVTWK